MPWRRTRISLAVFSFVWFCIVLPGHRRGAVVFDGGKVGRDCCCDQSGGGDKTKSPENRAAHCEICNFAAHLTLPPVVDFAPPLVCLAVLREAPGTTIPPLLRVRFVRQDRAPPVGA